MFLAIKYLTLSRYFLSFCSFIHICVYAYEYKIVFCVYNGVNEVARSIHAVLCTYMYVYFMCTFYV